ncbi:MAG: hypothetical protein QOF92_3704, partial [Pseudonocardiales bacterium]|nr:hypothetical protein [Pseudonocardiales bacterium]
MHEERAYRDYSHSYDGGARPRPRE